MASCGLSTTYFPVNSTVASRTAGELSSILCSMAARTDSCEMGNRGKQSQNLHGIHTTDSIKNRFILRNDQT